MTTTDLELHRRRRWAVLATCCLSLLIVGLDNTIMNVALPSLGRDLHADVAGLQWAVDAYVLAFASLLVLGGSLADRFGRRRVFRIGLTTFSAASLLCSLAPGLGWLVGFRVLQGMGASMLNPVAMSIITNTFVDRRERARAIGVWGAVVGISMALGPVVGGLLVSSVGWPSIFWINVPVGVTALVLTWWFVPESRAARARRLDPVGQALMIALLAATTASIIEAPRLGWTAPGTLGLAGLGLLAGVSFVTYELRRREPLLELRFFRSAPFSGATLIAVAAFGGFSGFLFLNTLYLQDVRGMSALAAGLYTLPMALPVILCSPLSGRLVAARGPRLPLVVAGVLLTAGALMLTGLDENTSRAWLVTSYVVFGAGFGAVNAPITNTAVSGMPLARAGVAAAIASTSRQVGQLLGVAVIGTVVSSVAGSTLAVRVLAAGAGWWIVTGCGLLVLVLAVLSTGRWARATAARTAELIGAADEEESMARAAKVGVTA